MPRRRLRNFRLRWETAQTLLPAASATAASIIGILTVLTFFLGAEESPLPKVQVVTAATVLEGGSLDLLGENLDLVAEIFLTQGSAPPIQTAWVRRGRTRITVAAPPNLKPGEYNIEFRTLDGQNISSGQVVVIFRQSARLPSPTPTPEFTPVPNGNAAILTPLMKQTETIEDAQGQLDLVKRRVSDVDLRLSKIEKVILDNPADVLSLPLLERDVGDLRDEVRRVDGQTSRLFDLFVGVILAVVVALVGLFAGLLLQQRARRAEPISTENIAQIVADQLRQQQPSEEESTDSNS